MATMEAVSGLSPAATILDRLKALPPLRRGDGGEVTPCKMCGAPARFFCVLDFNTVCAGAGQFDMAGVPVTYLRCMVCECLFTTFCDDWSARDFAELIYNDRYLLADGDYDGTRATRDAAFMAGLLDGAKRMRILDYGSGLGHFARGMMAHGFDRVESYDPFARPARPEGAFDIITSFECIEHSADPVATIRDILSFMRDDGCMLIGQTLQPRDIEEVGGSWWYLGPRNGHIATFSYETIRAMADREGLVFENFSGLFALSRPARGPYLTALLAPRAEPDRRTMIFAPGAEIGTLPGWHGCEQGADFAFRWTGASEVDLGEVVLNGETDLVVPFVNLRSGAMLHGSRLRIGDTEIPLRARRRELVAASVVLPPGRYPVTFISPPPLAPDVAGTQDTRLLGLAIRCAPPQTGLNPIRANLWRSGAPN